MPVTPCKNKLYAAALPLIGKRCRWLRMEATGGDTGRRQAVQRILHKHHVVGGCVQVIRDGQAAELYYAGYANLKPRRAVQPDTLFRTASIAKAVCALLVFRLQTQGKLSIEEDISAFWHSTIRNPDYPDTPIPLGALLSHSAGFVDTPKYFRSFSQGISADELLADTASFAGVQPYERFQYSNFGAGMIGSFLEHRFQQSIEELIQTELFQPLGVSATVDITKADINRLSNSYRILPPERTAAFDAAARLQSAEPITAPNPQRHFLLMSGNLLIAAEEMAKLCLLVMRSGTVDGKRFIDNAALHDLLTPVGGGKDHWPGIRHGMGMFLLDDTAVSGRRLHGHQGFAYGAVNGFFFDDDGTGFVSLNSGASEQRTGRLSLLNRDLIGELLP